MIPWDKLREECGVFGIRTNGASAAPYAHLGLYALQHRGQESAGIATFDGQRHAPRTRRWASSRRCSPPSASRS